MQRFGWLAFAVMVACSGRVKRVNLGDGLQPDDMAAAWKVAYCHYQAKCGLYGDEATCIASNLPTGLAIGHDEQVAAEGRQARVGRRDRTGLRRRDRRV